ncbi:triphosphoribosyl-dephospho-CoA synthase, partial [Salmonella enterica subsp. enterica serovar Virginia]|nr:triphosphoribosyl-dephospho-CoA synthase [Salmonella enterica subsp. enterica serovar Virginia]
VMLRPLGMACENDMLQATNGVNTHRGAIFAFGLLSAAIGRLLPARPTGHSTGNGFHSLSVFPLFLLRARGQQYSDSGEQPGR